jgi:hypothetical protein
MGPNLKQQANPSAERLLTQAPPLPTMALNKSTTETPRRRDTENSIGHRNQRLIPK